MPTTGCFIGALLGFAACDGNEPIPAAAAPVDSGTDALVTTTDAAPSADASPPDASNCMKQPQGVVSFFTGDGTPADLGPAGNGLSFASGAATYAPSEVGLGFDLAPERLLSKSTPTGLDGLSQITIELWMRSSDAGDIDLVGRSTSGTNGWRLSLGGRRLAFAVAAGQGGGSGQSSISLNQPHHVAVVYEGSRGKATFYVDGIFDGSSTSSTALSVLPAVGELRIGARGDSDKGTFLGWLDEITIYDVALDAATIKAIHDAGPKGKCRN